MLSFTYIDADFTRNQFDLTVEEYTQNHSKKTEHHLFNVSLSSSCNNGVRVWAVSIDKPVRVEDDISSAETQARKMITAIILDKMLMHGVDICNVIFNKTQFPNGPRNCRYELVCDISDESTPIINAFYANGVDASQMLKNDVRAHATSMAISLMAQIRVNQELVTTDSETSED